MKGTERRVGFGPGAAALERHLRARQAAGGFCFYGLDGFLAGVAAGPEAISVEDWAPVALGASVTEVGKLPDGPEVVDAVARRFNEILEGLADGSYQPILAEGEDRLASAHGWALGFQTALEVRPEAWEPLTNDFDAARLVVPTVILAADEAQRRAIAPAGFAPEVLAELIDALPEVVANVAEFFAEQELGENLGEDEAGWAQAAATLPPKVGRNEPCPCGSGKKFKKCCGG